MTKARNRIIISFLVITFVLLSVMATIMLVFAMQQQNISTSLNINYTAVDIDGSVSGTYSVGGVTKDLQPNADENHVGGTNNKSLLFFAEDTENAGTLEFPTDDTQINFTSQNSSMVMQYTFTNNGDVHYIASMSFDAELKYENMKVEYSIDGINYSGSRYAVVVPANSKDKSYWIRISIDKLTKNASFEGDFNWLLEACDEQSEEYIHLTSFELQGENGVYSVKYVGEAFDSGNQDLVFLSEVNGDPVTSIVANTELTQEQKALVSSLYIPASVTEIGDNAFKNYTELEAVIFEQNEQAGVSAMGITGLQTIGNSAFHKCSSLKAIQIPDTVTEIESFAFNGCSSITEIVIPNKVTKLTSFQIMSCKNLTHITLGSSVESFFPSTIMYCENLTNIEVASDNKKFHSEGNCLIETATKTLVLGCKNSVIPTDGSVTIIGNMAFWGCTGLTEIEIPACVVEIGQEAFMQTGLTEITIPENVTKIACRAFNNCENLTSVIFENPNGWMLGSTDVSAELSDPENAANYLKQSIDTYLLIRTVS